MRLRQIVRGKQGVERINELLTMHLGPEDVLLTLSLDFKDDLSAGQVEEAITELEDRIKQAFPQITLVFIEAQSWKAHRLRQIGASLKVISKNN